MKERNSKALGIISAIVTLLAVTVSSTACFVWAYQPKTPKCLQK